VHNIRTTFHASLHFKKFPLSPERLKIQSVIISNPALFAAREENELFAIKMVWTPQKFEIQDVIHSNRVEYGIENFFQFLYPHI